MIRLIVVLMRLPVALIASLVITGLYLAWLTAETFFALLLFPLCAVFQNAAWLHLHWPGTFPVALRRFLSLAPPESQQQKTSFWTQLFGGPKYLMVRTKRGGGLNTISRYWRWAFSPNEVIEEQTGCCTIRFLRPFGDDYDSSQGNSLLL